MCLCHQSSHTICGCCQDLTLWNWKNPHILEMLPYPPIVPEGIKDQDGAPYSWV